MTEWFDGLSALQQTLFVIALFSTSVFAIQVVFSLFGIGEMEDPGDHEQAAVGDDIGGDGVSFGSVFTVRNGVAFLMGLSWGGLMAYDWGLTHTFFVMLVGVVLGALFTGINIGLLALLSLLRHEGNLRVERAVGAPATVTLSVPERRTGVGKVSVSLQGRLQEFHAITDGPALKRNATVTVLEQAGSQLIVGDDAFATRLDAPEPRRLRQP